MRFSTSTGRDKVVRIPNPDPTLTVTTLNSVADRFTTNHIFDETVGNLLSLVRADRVVIERIAIL